MVQRKMTLLGVESTVVLEESIFQLHDYRRSIVEQTIHPIEIRLGSYLVQVRCLSMSFQCFYNFTSLALFPWICHALQQNWLRIREFQDEITRLKMQLEKRGGPGSPPRPPPQEGEEVVVETEVVEVEKNLGCQLDKFGWTDQRCQDLDKWQLSCMFFTCNHD